MANDTYQIQRLQIISIAHNLQMRSPLPDSYVYAWQYGVYPIRHEEAEFHKPFADDFPGHHRFMIDLVQAIGGEVFRDFRPKNFGDVTDAIKEKCLDGRFVRSPRNTDRLVAAGMRYLCLSKDRFSEKIRDIVANSRTVPDQAALVNDAFLQARDARYF